MRIALFGGTGRIGGQVLGWALERGHQVTVLARDPAGLAAPPAAVSVVAGDVGDPAAVRQVVDHADAVLSALGPRGARTPSLLGVAARNITAAMLSCGVRRLVCVSAAGAFIRADPDSGALVKIVLPRVLAKPFADVRDMEEVFAASGLDWTMVRVTRLVDGARTGRYRVRPDYPPAGGGKISRADVADFIGAVVTEGNWVHGRPALAY